MTFRNITFLVFSGGLIALTIGLGNWQLQRKKEKETLIESLNQRQFNSPQNIDDLRTPELLQPLMTKGTFLPGKRIYLQSKVHKGKNGLFVLDVFQTEKGKFLLVQRGWTQSPLKGPIPKPLVLQGSARFPTKPTFFQPLNSPPTYFWIDLNALSQEFNLPLEQYYLVEKTSFNPSIFPTKAIPSLSNRHLHYALTWYGLALALFGMVVYFLTLTLTKEKK